MDGVGKKQDGRGAPATGGVASARTGDDQELISALRAGQEAAFASLLDQYHSSMLRLARMYVHGQAVAEEVVQEAWLGVLEGIHGFEARSSLKTWIFRIVMNRAKTRAQREGRTIPFSALRDATTGDGEPSVEPGRFFPADHPLRARHWAVSPRAWGGSPEERLLSKETRAFIEQTIASLPSSQGEVIARRDIDGWTSAEVRELLGLSEANQRVLLHRARAKVRRALERYFGDP